MGIGTPISHSNNPLPISVSSTCAGRTIERRFAGEIVPRSSRWTHADGSMGLDRCDRIGIGAERLATQI